MKLVPITGNTFPVKEALKGLGARWNGDLKAWMVPPEKADEANRIVAAAPKPAARPKKRYGGWSKPRDGGPRGHKPCYMCGSYYCDGARGGLCDDD